MNILLKRRLIMAEEIKFCPLLTVVRAGQASYLACQTTCVFYLENECAFITSSKALKELMRSKAIDQDRKDKSEK
jgi:hypothetical protein